jgi:ubiquitin carboxyl-terminal hydrolase 14
VHKGRSSSSGHYIAFVRRDVKKDGWLVFDDDAVEETTSEVVANRLKGGGDDFMAYMCFYSAT